MDLIPLRTISHTEEEGRVVLLVPKFTGRFMHTLFPVTEKMYFRIKLDDTGSKVWNAIDGDSTIVQIADHMDSSGMEMEEIADNQSRLLKFVSTLYEREYIIFRQLM